MQSPCSNRIPEAALMARSYLPSKVSEIVAIWRKDLNKVSYYSLIFVMFMIYPIPNLGRLNSLRNIRRRPPSYMLDICGIFSFYFGFRFLFWLLQVYKCGSIREFSQPWFMKDSCYEPWWWSLSWALPLGHKLLAHVLFTNQPRYS